LVKPRRDSKPLANNHPVGDTFLSPQCSRPNVI
jgi:hypothetical protein